MASNTSTLPVSGLAEQWSRPEEFIGLHFSSPVERMTVVEVILGRKTSPHALARTLDFVAQLRKLPIVVNDSPSFYTSRIFCAYIDEAMAMLAEGIFPALIENAAHQAGFATAPLAAIDEVSLDLHQLMIRQAAADGLPAQFLRQHAQPVVDAMVARGRLGRKSGGGFHDFVPSQPKRLWPELTELFLPSASQPPLVDVKNRLLYVVALESARCVEEKVVPEAADADLGSVLALGYPKWTGGTLSFIETEGLANFVAECDRLADLYGERFRPSAWLRERASSLHAFYPTT
jgi:3-hydroxyacyl-CoA dehydrogenase/enoyl-CoA hydratase/3-hydroxybutyryl-CoA epimerase